MRLLLTTLLAACAAQAQTTPDAAASSDEKKLGKLEGHAIHALTGVPVRKAELSLTTRGSEFRRTTTITDANGRFSFDNLEPGTYRLGAHKAGFLDQTYGSNNPQGAGTPVTVAAGQHISDLEFKLTPQGVITGKVVDDDGEPVPKAMVNIMLQSGRATRPLFFEGASTNDLGEFRVANISPGRYFAAAQVADFQEHGDASPKKKDIVEEAYVPTYYPGVTEPASAAAFEVKPGQEVSGIFITLRKSHVYRVSGKISGLTAAHSPRSMGVSLASRDRKERMTAFGWGGAGSVKPDGSFEIANVQPGAYYASIYLLGDGRPQVIGRTPVDVTDGNVSGVVLPMLEPLNLIGSVRMEGDQKIGFDVGSIILFQADLLPGSNPRGKVNADGTFKIDGVGPDKYYLNLYNLPETVCLKSARLGKQEALDSGLDLTEAQGTVNLELVLSTKPGTVEGSVREDTKPITGASVLLARDPMIPALRFVLKQTNTDQNGRFTINGIAPGNYKLYSWQSDPGFEPGLDPDALKPFESKAVKVTVEEGGSAHFDLTPIQREDAEAQ